MPLAIKQASRRNLRDAALIASIALPAAASTTVVTAGIDLGDRTLRSCPPDAELVLKVPALSTTILPDTRTATLTIEASSSSSFAGTPETLRTLVLTGAGGAGAPSGGELRVALPVDVDRYVRGKVVFGASTTDGSALSAEFAVAAG